MRLSYRTAVEGFDKQIQAKKLTAKEADAKLLEMIEMGFVTDPIASRVRIARTGKIKELYDSVVDLFNSHRIESDPHKADHLPGILVKTDDGQLVVVQLITRAGGSAGARSYVGKTMADELWPADQEETAETAEAEVEASS